MKRLLTLAAMFLCCIATSFAQFSGSGSGTESDPYLILNPYQLSQMRNYLNQTGVYFKLMSDINLTDYLNDENPSQGWQPIGSTHKAAFKGILDGNGKTISGLWIKRPSTENVGFFGYTIAATIKNLKIVATTIEGKNNVGGISGSGSDTTISGCTFSGSVSGESYIGGYVGKSDAVMKLSNDIATVTVTGTGDYVGGFIGHNDRNSIISGCVLHDGNITGSNYVGGFYGAIENRINNEIGSISGTYIHADILGNNYVGGIYGGQTGSLTRVVNINNCGYAGNIVGNSYVGGLVGDCHPKGTKNTNVIQNSFAVGSISAAGDYVGGLLGNCLGSYYGDYLHINHVKLYNCYYSGSISGANYVGGLIGYMNIDELSRSYCVGTVAGKKYVGGLVGYNDVGFADVNSTLKTSVAINSRVTATEGNVGRIVGYNRGTIGAMGSSDENKAYNRTIVISQGVAQEVTDNLQNGTGVGAASLKLKANYVAMGWDFTNTWDIQETESYPYMKSQTAPPVITSQVVSGATVVSGKCVDGSTVTLLIDGEKQEKVSTGNTFTFNVSPLQAGHEIRLCAKAAGKEQSYYTTAIVSFLGSGTEADPYQVYTAADLTNVYYKGYYKLMNDIDLIEYISQYYGTNGWESIGRDGSETIYFDGDGHKITGLWCNSTRENTGLFSCFANGYIKDLTVVTASGKQVKGKNCTGILIGKLINGQIENCKVEGSVVGTSQTGGMLGSLSGGSIKNCKVEGTVVGTTQVGGILGLMSGGSINNCQTNINVSSETGDTYIGGIAGVMTGAIDQCLTKGTISSTGSNTYAAGVAGKNNTGSSITNSYTTAYVSSSYCAAGIVGYNYGLVEKCYASGNIYSRNYGAGVIGYNDGSGAIVRYCAAMCKKLEVIYESQSQQGGGYGQRIIGGIKNGAPAPETSVNYALKTMQVSVNDVPQTVYDDIMNGTSKSSTELMAQATYETLTWDFTDIWKIEEGSSYPYLVVKEGGSDDPIVTTSDVLSVKDVTIVAGTTATIAIDLNNITTDYTGYQFDIILPEGFSVALNPRGKLDFAKGNRYEDDSQQLSMESLGGNTYRVLSFSMSNGLIEGNEGAIMTFTVQSESSLAEGEYTAILKDIVFTESDGTQSEMADATFKLTICNVIKGDANGDTMVNVSDIVEIVNYILGRPSTKFNAIAADVSEDGVVNVTDIVRVVSIIMTAGNTNNLPRMAVYNNNDLMVDDNSVKLNDAGKYTAAQFDIHLSEGQSVEDITLKTFSDHHIIWQKIGDNTCRVVLFSMNNELFDARGGALVNIKMDGNCTICDISNVLLVPADENTTGISISSADKKDDVWYSIEGKRLKGKPTQKGVYINNGTKYILR